ncbi:MAG: response regulator transcription factor [Acidobacteriaceae bacterium]
MPRPQNQGKIRILLVDDHPVVLTGLTTLLQQDPEMVVVGMANDGQAALELLDRTVADVVLLDLRMPGRSGLDVLRDIGRLFPRTRVIILSGFQFDEEIHQSVIRGAYGYLPKDVASREIFDAIHSVHQGNTYFPKHIMERLDSRRSRPDLTKREMEILELVAKGFTNKEIANALRLSQFTVRNHLNRITSKLEVADRTEAAFVAIQTGIVSISH